MQPHSELWQQLRQDLSIFHSPIAPANPTFTWRSEELANLPFHSSLTSRTLHCSSWAPFLSNKLFSLWDILTGAEAANAGSPAACNKVKKGINSKGRHVQHNHTCPKDIMDWTPLEGKGKVKRETYNLLLFIPSVPSAIPPSLLLASQWEAWWSFPSALKAKMTWVLAGNILGTLMRTVHAVAEDTGPYSSSWDGKTLLQSHKGFAGRSQDPLLRGHLWQWWPTTHLHWAYQLCISTCHAKEWRQTVYAPLYWPGRVTLPSSTG